MEKEEKAVMLNPFCDEGFKRIFGDKILLMDFLNSFVDTEAPIVDLTYENKELVPEENDRRSIIFDLFCKLDNGKHVIIEKCRTRDKITLWREHCFIFQERSLCKEKKERSGSTESTQSLECSSRISICSTTTTIRMCFVK